MKILLLAMALLASGLSAPAFAQAPNDIASKLKDAHDYSQGRSEGVGRDDSPSHHAVRHRARRHRRHHASQSQAPMGQAPDAPAAAQ